MKKLMIVAAIAAASVGAYAGLCDVDGDASSCEGYDVSITLKTLTQKVLKCKENCVLSSEDCVPYFLNGKRTFKGILWMCESDCSFDGAQLVLWRTDKGHSGYAIGTGLTIDTTEKTYKALDFKNDLLGFVNRYDKKADKVQMAWVIDALQECYWDSKAKAYATTTKVTTTASGISYGGADLPDYSLMLAGFGSFDKKALRVKSVSGGVAGTVGADPTDRQCNYPYGFLVATCTEFLDYCEGDGDIEGDPDSTAAGIDSGDTSALAAYGTWKLKYNAKYAKSTSSIASYVPAYAK